jgi:hypothetical protein
MSRYNLGKKEITHDVWVKIKENCSKQTAFTVPDHGVFDIAYGFDVMGCGYFIQFFNDEEPEDENGFENVVNIDSMFDNFTGAELGFILQQLECPHQDHIEMAYLDLEF